MKYTTITLRTTWRDENRAFARTGLSTLAPEKEPSEETKLEHLLGLESLDGVH